MIMRKQKAQKQLLSGLLALMLCLFLLPATVFAAGGMTLKVSPANAADDTAPRAKGATYQTLAGAIAAAESGDIIEITENISVDATIQIATDLTICGSDATITVTRDAGHTAGPVLEIEDGASVTITNLILDGGAQWDDAENHYERTNSGVTAGHGTHNTASTGTGYDDPGSYLLVHGSLTLTTGAQVQNCHYRITRTANTNDTAAYAGGAAVYVTGTGVLTMEQDARVHDNMLSVDSAASEVWYASGAGGAAIRVNGGTLNLRDSASIDCNSALDTKANGWGGGVCLGGAGTLNLESGSISGNYARNGGGGIAAMQGGGEINLSGVSISNNVCAGPQGGGGIGTMTVSPAGPLTITMSGGEISGNASASNTQGPGGGIYLMNSSSAISTFVMTGGTITGNKLGTASSSKGGGVCLGQNATAVLLDGEISGNIVSDNLRYGQAPGTAVAIGHAKAKCYLKADTMTIGGDIHVGSAQYIELIGASETMGNYVASTDRSASYMAEGRVVVRPGSYEYNGTTYEVTDAEQYVNHFSSTYKGVTTNTEFTGNPDSENALGLRGWTLSFDLNVPAGAAAKPNPESIAPISELYMYQNIMGLAGFPNPDPTLDGYIFGGWYTNKAGTGTAITNAHVMGNFSTTLYAKWTEVTYALTMNLDGGDGADVSGSYAKDAEIAIDAGTKAGGNDFAYVFDGWLTSGGGTFANDKDAKTTFTMPGNDTTITATWRQVPTYALTMNLDGGDGTDVSGNYPEGTEIAIDAGMREHYAFAGWTTSDVLSG